MKILKNVQVEFEHNDHGLIMRFDKEYGYYAHCHLFKPNDAFYKFFEETSLEVLTDMYNGGTFILTSEECPRLIDFRFSNYSGFFNGKSKRYDEKIGIVYEPSEMLNHAVKNGNQVKNILMGGEHNKRVFDFRDEEYETGLWYLYSPFKDYMKLVPYLKNSKGFIFTYNKKALKLKYVHEYLLEKYGDIWRLEHKFENIRYTYEENMESEELSQEVCQLFYDILLDLEHDRIELNDKVGYLNLGESFKIEGLEDEYDMKKIVLFEKVMNNMDKVKNYQMVYNYLNDMVG